MIIIAYMRVYEGFVTQLGADGVNEVRSNKAVLAYPMRMQLPLAAEHVRFGSNAVQGFEVLKPAKPQDGTTAM